MDAEVTPAALAHLPGLQHKSAYVMFLCPLLEQPWPGINRVNPKPSSVDSVERHCSHQREASTREFKDPFSLPFPSPCGEIGWSKRTDLVLAK